MQEQRLKITLQLVKTVGEEGDSGDPDVTNPTRHRLKWSKESETHQRSQIENAFKFHSERVRSRSISAQSCTSEASPRREKTDSTALRSSTEGRG